MRLLKKLGLDKNMRAHKLTQDDIARLNSLITSEYMVEGDLRRYVQNNIKRLISIHSYRGQRHRLGCLYVDNAQEPILAREKVVVKPFRIRKNNYRSLSLCLNNLLIKNLMLK